MESEIVRIIKRFLIFPDFKLFLASFFVIALVSFSKGHVIACHLLNPQSCRPQYG
nr:MAG TPA: hypothetical protein [Caudoviricetes sp.]